MNMHESELRQTEKNKRDKTLDLAIGVRVPASQPKKTRIDSTYNGAFSNLI